MSKLKNKKAKILADIKKELVVAKELKIVTYATLVLLFLFSFYIRAIVPFKAVFSNGIVNFAMDDSVYQMRLVENTIKYFPYRITFDAFTQFPVGDSPGWGVLYTLIVATFAMITSFITSRSIQDSIGLAGAFTPAIFGSLIVFPVYYIGKELSGYKAGLIGAFLIAILPGQFLSRSLLGFSDHHVAEVFFTTFMMMFVIIAFKRAEGIKFKSYIDRDWKIIKTPIKYSILAGIAFGAYLLTWTVGVLFAVIFAVILLCQFIILQFKNKNSDYISVVGIITYLVAMIMVLPYVKISNGFSPSFYSLLHITVTGGAAIFVLYLSYLSNKIRTLGYDIFSFILTLIATIVIGIVIASFIAPEFIQSTLGSWGYMFTPHVGGSLTIAEGSPLSNTVAVAYFGYNFVLSYIALFVLLIYAVRKGSAEFTTIVIWSIFIHAITFAQNRFAYYYAVNVAILSAFLMAWLLDFLDAGSISLLKEIKIKHVLLVSIIILVIGFLPSTSSPFRSSCGDILTTMSCTTTQGGSLGEGQYEWYTSLNWMRNNTPEPKLEYLSIYEKPKPRQHYNYSILDYGVMSWWDYGHIITYWAHRIPNANPFQSGIGGGTAGFPGASPFLIATSEEEATNILYKLGINGQPGARYVVSNAYMAYNIQAVFAEWNNTNFNLYRQIQTSKGPIVVPTEKYYNTFESKLHIFDGIGLRQYRLVHESTPAPWFRGANEEKQQKDIYVQVYKGVVNIEDTGFVKIFEIVKGANISGQTTPNKQVRISSVIKTNIGRTFEYSQSTTSDANGMFTLTVPYSTKGPSDELFDCKECLFPANRGTTNFDTKPMGPYVITMDNKTAKIDIDEKDVLKGTNFIIN